MPVPGPIPQAAGKPGLDLSTRCRHGLRSQQTHRATQAMWKIDVNIIFCHENLFQGPWTKHFLIVTKLQGPAYKEFNYRGMFVDLCRFDKYYDGIELCISISFQYDGLIWLCAICFKYIMLYVSHKSGALYCVWICCCCCVNHQVPVLFVVVLSG